MRMQQSSTCRPRSLASTEVTCVGGQSALVLAGTIAVSPIEGAMDRLSGSDRHRAAQATRSTGAAEGSHAAVGPEQHQSEGGAGACEVRDSSADGKTLE